MLRGKTQISCHTICFLSRALAKRLVMTLLTVLAFLFILGCGIHFTMQIPSGILTKRDVTADDAEIYKNAAVAADTITCSEVGMLCIFRSLH